MSAKRALVELLERLPEERVQEILNFARSVSSTEEREEWAQFGREQFSRAYGENEPESTIGDIKPSLDQ